MHRMHRLLVLLPLLGCAPLDRLRMSEPCRALYDSCLNGCPKPPRMNDPAGGARDFQIEQAACTNRCNEQAKACK
jgi:hypothetical protein